MPGWVWAYLSFTVVLVATPGSTTAVVVRSTLAGGRAAGLAAALGAAFANSSHALAAGLGLAVVFMRWPAALQALRAAGAIYLGWLGMVSLYQAARHRDGGLPILSTVNDSVRVSPHSLSEITAATSEGFRQGLLVNLLNPAIATFYLVVVPTFLTTTATRWHFAALAAIHVALALLFHGAWAVGLDKLRKLFRPPLARRLLQAATGLALLALAARVMRQ